MKIQIFFSVKGHQRYVQTLQGQIQYHSSRAQGLQHSLDSLSAQQVKQKFLEKLFENRLNNVLIEIRHILDNRKLFSN